MKKTVSLLFFVFWFGFLFAQQDKQLTHYMFDKISYNPAATGFKGYCATAIYRNQWDRVQDAPNTVLVNLQANLPQQNAGIGVSFTNDAIGFQRNNTVTLNGAYHVLTNVGILSGGLGLGMVNVSFSPQWIPPQNPIDPNLPGPTAGTGLDANLGLHWYGTTAPYYVGISTTHVMPTALKNINYSVARHYYLLAGYTQQLTWNRRIDLKPSVLIKADGATCIFDVNLMADVWLNTDSYLWGGVSYRYADAVALNIGYAGSLSGNAQLDMFKIGYSFDIMTNPLNPYGRGTHELILNICLFPPKLIGKHCNPFILL